MLFKSLTWGCDVIAKNGNGCEEIAGRWQNNSLCPKQIRLPGVINVKIQTERHCPVKHFAFLKNVCYQYYNFVLWVTYCFLQAADWPTTNFLGVYCYFPVIWLANFVYVALVTQRSSLLFHVDHLRGHQDHMLIFFVILNLTHMSSVGPGSLICRVIDLRPISHLEHWLQ